MRPLLKAVGIAIAPRPSMTEHRGLSAFLLLALSVAVGGCAAVTGIFKAGVWVGILAVLFIAAVVALTTGMFRRP